MPTTLTKKERAYLGELRKRNSSYMENKEIPTKEYHKGLTKPMTANERKMRSRICKKAFLMAYEFYLIDRSGLMGTGSLKDSHSASGFVNQASIVHTIYEVSKEKPC